MDKENLKERLAELEATHQLLISEYTSIDQILQSIGFPRGMSSLKEVAYDLLSESHPESKSEH